MRSTWAGRVPGRPVTHVTLAGSRLSRATLALSGSGDCPGLQDCIPARVRGILTGSGRELHADPLGDMEDEEWPKSH